MRRITKVEAQLKNNNKHLGHDPEKRDAFLESKSLEKAKIKHLGYQWKIKGLIIEISAGLKKKRG